MRAVLVDAVKERQVMPPSASAKIESQQPTIQALQVELERLHSIEKRLEALEQANNM